jgi:hypothetical protein
MPSAGQALTLWTIRVAAGLYVAAVAGWLARRDRSSRAAWTAACGFYLVHVAAAFHFYHAWSHAAAYRETARQTAAVFGVNWGGGLYFNYAFTAIWIADVLWWWRGLEAYRRRPRWVTAAVHTFFAFMFLNATVVFAQGGTRWFGVAATTLLCVLWWRTNRSERLISSG